MSDFSELFNADLHRYGIKVHGWTKWFHYYLRRCQTCNSVMRKYYFAWYKILCWMRGIEILPQTKIGAGLYIGHPFNVTVNVDATIGKNVNLSKGVTIGETARGKNKGVPTLGDCVWVGTSAVVVGKITIGDDVMIAPNAFVNVDVPSHSIALGNPCKIIPKQNATAYYIDNIVEL